MLFIARPTNKKASKIDYINTCLADLKLLNPVKHLKVNYKKTEVTLEVSFEDGNRTWYIRPRNWFSRENIAMIIESIKKDSQKDYGPN